MSVWMCECEPFDGQRFYVWRDDPDWWSCEICDGRVKPRRPNPDPNVPNPSDEVIGDSA